MRLPGRGGRYPPYVPHSGESLSSAVVHASDRASPARSAPHGREVGPAFRSPSSTTGCDCPITVRRSSSAARWRDRAEKTSRCVLITTTSRDVTRSRNRACTATRGITLPQEVDPG